MTKPGDARPTTPARHRSRVAGTVALTATAVLALSVASAPVASAHGAKKSKTATVVQVVSRAPYGTMLATLGGASLYTTPGSCTGGCLTVWPPLVMPKGKKVPTGFTGLSTVKVKVGHASHLQVTYNGRPLYTFDADAGTSVNGNDVGGFVVATVP